MATYRDFLKQFVGKECGWKVEDGHVQLRFKPYEYGKFTCKLVAVYDDYLELTSNEISTSLAVPFSQLVVFF